MEDLVEASLSPTKNSRSSTKSLTPALPSNRSKRRATRACDRCKHKKMRCSGQKPCAHCTGAGVEIECSYTAKYTRGKAPPIQSASPNESWKSGAGWIPGVGSANKRDQSPDNSSESSSSEQVDPLSHKSDNIETHDKDSHNFASAYRRTQHDLIRLSAPTHKNPVYAHGDPLLPEADLSFFMLPPLDEARTLVAKFFEVITPNMRIMHQPTVDKWLLSVLQSFKTGQRVDNARSAVILLILASAYNHQDVSSKEGDKNISFRLFQAADDLLTREKGEVRLESVQARVIQCYYLLSRARVNHAWSCLATAVSHIYLMQMHRKAKFDRQEEKDLIHAECCKKAFWSAYTVDKYFSLAFGRPEWFNDEMIDQENPLMVNDDNLTKTNYVETKNEAQCTMTSTIYQKQISVILGATNRDLYGIRTHSLEKRLALARKHHNSLKILAHTYRAFLGQDITSLRILTRQQIFGLKISHLHLVIVIFRPFLLHNPLDGEEINLAFRDEHENNVVECLKASMDMTELLNAIFQVSQFFNGSWFTHFCGFTAIVALYVYVIKHQSDPEESWIAYFKAAERCQQQIKGAADKESFSKRSSQILDDLHAEATSHILRKKRREEHDAAAVAVAAMDHQQLEQDMRSQEPQYSEQFNMQVADLQLGQPLPEYTYGYEWQNMNFDQTAPGGGILGSMDWISMQNPASVVDQIERWGFSSLNGW